MAAPVARVTVHDADSGLRPTRAHEGRLVAPASNQRWSSDGLEVSCWNGENRHDQVQPRGLAPQVVALVVKRWAEVAGL